MAIIESVRNFIANCPLLEDYEGINVEFLSAEVGCFSIEEVPSETLVERFVNGDEVRQFTFILASRFFYSDEAINNINNSGFYESFSNWILECNYTNNLPELEDGLTATSLEVMTSGYLFNIASDMRDARYQVQCRLIYDYERN